MMGSIHSGKLFFEKKIPENIIIGKVIRLIIPPMAGMLAVLLAQSNAKAVKAPDPKTHSKKNSKKFPCTLNRKMR